MSYSVDLRERVVAHVREHSDMILRERAAHFGVRMNAIWVALQQMKISKRNDAVRGKSFRYQNRILAHPLPLGTATQQPERGKTIST